MFPGSSTLRVTCGFATVTLISTYQQERGQVTRALISFDFEHTAAFADGDSKALAENLAAHKGIISGAGLKHYAANVLNVPEENHRGSLWTGEHLALARFTRYIDINPVPSHSIFQYIVSPESTGLCQTSTYL
ncbi:uncharacterized protein Z519_02827 [Cladophialophora bantiana CBS 173.52]|uniref:Uncharacterized protein n=1 Tax=Cladophialophora bantiana (strain ATCC 10958 / CBS 173.52 / CDC B-1940 / NIH 8579) TaxID=1442370 RepID=A0A0D2HQN9_CLAB1|nr:uncharacterized protein Z519_02827 [Cladophialophora bantiana CBS 173.52]KIW95763.1 hypothetical protein Z519_02827 [Cladophialophora bantiana CBS 173.52]